MSRKDTHAHIHSISLDLFENINGKVYLEQRNSFLISSSYIRVLNHLALSNELNKLFWLDNIVIFAGDFNSHNRWCSNSNMDNLGETLHNYCNNNDAEISAPAYLICYGSTRKRHDYVPGFAQ